MDHARQTGLAVAAARLTDDTGSKRRATSAVRSLEPLSTTMICCAMSGMSCSTLPMASSSSQAGMTTAMQEASPCAKYRR